MRKYAEEAGMDFASFNRMMQEDKTFEYDKRVDDELLKFMSNNKNFIIDSRLAVYFAKREEMKDVKSIYLSCKFLTAVKRVYLQKLGEGLKGERHIEVEIDELDIAGAYHDRTLSEAYRYHELYGYNLINTKTDYNYVVDTTVKTIEETFEDVKNYLLSVFCFKN
jgi:cytidylate kinase